MKKKVAKRKKAGLPVRSWAKAGAKKVCCVCKKGKCICK